MKEEGTLQLHAIFRGHVQGVGFRYTTKRIADRLFVKGTVRNVSDGSVELYAQGDKKNLEILLKELELQFNLDIERDCFISFSASGKTFKDFSVSYPCL